MSDSITIEIAKVVADHWRNAALRWGDERIPARLMAHPLCCVLAALDGKSARAEDFGIARGPDAEHIAALGYKEAGERERAEAGIPVSTIRSELEKVAAWAAEQNAGNAFADQVRQWALSKLGELPRVENGQAGPQ